MSVTITSKDPCACCGLSCAIVSCKCYVGTNSVLSGSGGASCSGLSVGSSASATGSVAGLIFSGVINITCPASLASINCEISVSLHGPGVGVTVATSGNANATRGNTVSVPFSVPAFWRTNDMLSGAIDSACAGDGIWTLEFDVAATESGGGNGNGFSTCNLGIAASGPSSDPDCTSWIVDSGTLSNSLLAGPFNFQAVQVTVAMSGMTIGQTYYLLLLPGERVHGSGSPFSPSSTYGILIQFIASASSEDMTFPLGFNNILFPNATPPGGFNLDEQAETCEVSLNP